MNTLKIMTFASLILASFTLSGAAHAQNKNVASNLCPGPWTVGSSEMDAYQGCNEMGYSYIIKCFAGYASNYVCQCANPCPPTLFFPINNPQPVSIPVETPDQGPDDMN